MATKPESRGKPKNTVDFNHEYATWVHDQTMNEAFEKLENFLSGFESIATFTSDVSSANRGEMAITFKEEHEKDGSPDK